jgi:hypothetical protein
MLPVTLPERWRNQGAESARRLRELHCQALAALRDKGDREKDFCGGQGTFVHTKFPAPPHPPSFKNFFSMVTRGAYRKRPAIPS